MSVTPATTPRRRLPGWAVAEGPFGIRIFDVGLVVLAYEHGLTAS